MLGVSWATYEAWILLLEPLALSGGDSRAIVGHVFRLQSLLANCYDVDDLFEYHNLYLCGFVYEVDGGS